MNPHGTPGHTPERQALESAEVQARLGADLASAMRIGMSLPQVVAYVEEWWVELSQIQIAAAAEAGRHAVRRRGPRRQKGTR
jgi:hypothetical protein